MNGHNKNYGVYTFWFRMTQLTFKVDPDAEVTALSDMTFHLLKNLELYS